MQMKEYQFYKEHQAEIAAGHLGEFVVISGQKIQGYYKVEKDALHAVRDIFASHGSFIVQPCQMPGTDIVKFYGYNVFRRFCHNNRFR
jgi:hypothetical protein